MRKKIPDFNKEQVCKGDKFTFTEDINIYYYGEVTQILEALIALMDKAENIKINTKELKHGKSLIQEVLNKIEIFEKKYKERQNGKTI